MAQTKPVPHIPYNEVSQRNFEAIHGDILDTISRSKYIALDTEFTGHCQELDLHMEKRYENLRNVVRSHAIVSFGLTTVEVLPDGHFSTRNLEFLTSNQETFSVNPSNLKFLAENGLDFSRHFSLGIPYRSGGNANDLKLDKKHVGLIRNFWHAVLRLLAENKIPIIVHNGFLDLMYIYQSFVCDLPNTFHTFVADLLEIFPGGIYDTKHLVSQALNEEKHWLAYLYCKFDRVNRQQPDSSLVIHAQEPIVPSKSQRTTSDLNRKRGLDSDEDMAEAAGCSRSQKRRKRHKKFAVNSKPNADTICIEYGRHGFCKKGKLCQRSHDLRLILDHDLGIQSRSEPSKPESLEETQIAKPQSIDNHKAVDMEPEETNQRRDHSAHFDAYMTAYVFCYSKKKLGDEELSQYMNKLYLMRHRHPLTIATSHYANCSSNWAAVKKHIWPGKAAHENPDLS